MTATPETCIPLNWLLALPARLRAAIIHCELTLDDIPPPPTSSRRLRAPRFIPRSGAKSPEACPSPTLAERVERLAAACRIPEETILQYIRAHWDSDCAEVSSAPRAVLEEVVRAWPDILAEISGAKWHGRPSDDLGEIPAPSLEHPLPDDNIASLEALQNGSCFPPVNAVTR